MPIPGLEKDNRKNGELTDEPKKEENKEIGMIKKLNQEIEFLWKNYDEIQLKLKTYEELLEGLLNIVEEHLNGENKEEEVQEKEPIKDKIEKTFKKNDGLFKTVKQGE